MEKKIEEILPVLDSMARFFSLRRQRDRELIVGLLTELDTNMANGLLRLQDLQGHTARLDKELVSELANNEQLTSQIATIKQDLAAKCNLEVKLKGELATLVTEQNLVRQELQGKHDVITQLQKEIGVLTNSNKQLTDQFALLQEEHNTQGVAFEQLRTHNADLGEKFDLITAILAARPHDLLTVKRFRNLFEQDFLEFANRESSLANEAEAVLMMQKVLERLELTANFPHLFTKTTGAIGGSFSSGKSEFLNSFFNGKEIKLPIGINPVTSLPSYVVASPDSFIHGHARNGGVVPIALKIFSRFTPDYLSSFSFNIKEIMPMMSIGVSLDHACFQHLCLIDTPGYNAPDRDGYRAEDRHTAMAQLHKSRFIIWIIGIDTNGTISKSDIEFLMDQGLEGKQLYLVLNKADLRTTSDIAAIMDEVAESLEDREIPFAGISAYSALERKEYSHTGLSLTDFLKKQNQAEQTVQILKEKVESVFSMYQQAISDDIQKQKKHRNDLHSLKLDMLEIGAESTDNKAYDRIVIMESAYNIDVLKMQLQNAEELRQKFSKVLDDFESELFGRDDRESQQRDEALRQTNN